MNDLSEFFHHTFDVLTDNKYEVLDEAFRLRYQVYCLETGFEDRTAFSDRRERDQFDAHSVHGVIKHRDSDTGLATVRLVMTPHSDLGGRFPIEHQFPRLLAEHGINDRMLPRQSTGEISRFAVSKDIGRQLTRVGTGASGQSALRDAASASRPAYSSRRRPWVTFGLFLALVRLSAQHDITHWLAVMEPSLLRLLSRFGIHFTPIGGTIEYHGKRQPCFGRVDRVLDGIRDQQPELWQLITDDGLHHKPALPLVSSARAAEHRFGLAS